MSITFLLLSPFNLAAHGSDDTSMLLKSCLTAEYLRDNF